MIELTIDGEAVSVTEGSTILDACKSVGTDTPTLCYLESLTPVNACRPATPARASWPSL